MERTSTPLRDRYIGNARVFSETEVARIAVRPGDASPWEVTGPVYDQAEHAGLDDVSTMQLVDINTWLAGDILVKADRMTMAHSLELRVPFLDAEVLKVASRLSRTEKIGAGTTKLALRSAMSEVLPKAAAERAKLGFPVPIGHWLTGDSYGFAEQLLRDAQTDEWINRDEALRLLEGLRAGEPGVEWRHLWVLIVFSLWHQIFVERAYDPVALGWERAARVPRAHPGAAGGAATERRGGRGGAQPGREGDGEREMSRRPRGQEWVRLGGRGIRGQGGESEAEGGREEGGAEEGGG